MRRSPRVLLAWSAALVVALTTARVVGGDLADAAPARGCRSARGTASSSRPTISRSARPSTAADVRAETRYASEIPRDAITDRTARPRARRRGSRAPRRDRVRASPRAGRSLRASTVSFPLGDRAVHVAPKDGFRPPLGAVVDVLAAFDPTRGRGRRRPRRGGRGRERRARARGRRRVGRRREPRRAERRRHAARHRHRSARDRVRGGHRRPHARDRAARIGAARLTRSRRVRTTFAAVISTVIFDFGGVISSPLFVGHRRVRGSRGLPQGLAAPAPLRRDALHRRRGTAVAAVADAIADDPDAAEAAGEVARRARLAPAREGPARRRDLLRAHRRSARRRSSAPTSTWRPTAASGGRAAPGVHWMVVHKIRELKAPRPPARSAHEQREGVRRPLAHDVPARRAVRRSRRLEPRRHAQARPRDLRAHVLTDGHRARPRRCSSTTTPTTSPPRARTAWKPCTSARTRGKRSRQLDAILDRRGVKGTRTGVDVGGSRLRAAERHLAQRARSCPRPRRAGT